MTRELQSTLKASAIQWPAWRNHIPCMAHVIRLAWGAFMSSLGVKRRTKSWEAYEHHQQSGENEGIDVEMSQTLKKEGNARINQVSAMKPGLAKIIEIVRISWYFGSPEIDLHIAENACWIDYTETWSSKQLYWLSKDQSSHRSTTDYGSGDTGVAQPCSCSSAPTYYGNSYSSGSKIQNTLITSHFSQLKMSGPLWCMASKY